MDNSGAVPGGSERHGESRRSAIPAGDADGGSLPCLSSNNCNEQGSARLSTQHRKAASALAWNVQAMAEKWGIERLGFLTLTFRDHVLDGAEAQRRFRSLRTGVLNKRYRAWMRVLERQKSGRIHYHLVVVLDDDIRQGVDFAAIAAGDYRTSGEALRREWAFWRRTAPRYRFGRTELLPVISTAEGIARYVGKYISKHMDAREEGDKGLRLVEYSRGARVVSTRFAWATENAATWRAKLGLFARMVAKVKGGKPSLHNITEKLGPRWAYHHRDFILSLPDPREESTPVDSVARESQSVQYVYTRRSKHGSNDEYSGGENASCGWRVAILPRGEALRSGLDYGLVPTQSGPGCGGRPRNRAGPNP